jgi:hypothetical protein
MQLNLDKERLSQILSDDLSMKKVMAKGPMTVD